MRHALRKTFAGLAHGDDQYFYRLMLIPIFALRDIRQSWPTYLHAPTIEDPLQLLDMTGSQHPCKRPHWKEHHHLGN